jgi:polyisoprenoid-binding protein YceI
MRTLLRSARLATALLLLAVASCKREQKPPVRTEPWPAPGVSGSASAAPARAAYTLTRGKATIALTVEKKRVHAAVTRFDGSLDVDFENPQHTRGNIRADLRSITLEGDEGDSDAITTAEVFEQLGLHEGDDEHRYAELTLTAIDPGPREGAGRNVSAQGNLTLHGFRVPVVLELSIDRVASDGAGSLETLRVRTRRPLRIPLMAHGLLPEATPGSKAPGPRSFGRDASISAEIEAEPTPDALEP